MNIPINQHAPVKASDTIEILAPIEIVWGVLTQIEAWPSWQKAVTEARMEAPLQEGTPFKWKAGGLSFRSKIHTMQAQTQFGWTGKTIGANAIHNWSFQDKNGTTTVKVEESLQGIFPKLFKTYFQTSLEKGIKINLEELKQEAEIKAGK